MKAHIAVPYFPGSNGDIDAIERISEFSMTPVPLYFHFHNDKMLRENSQRLMECDGAFLPGGFPYEDRLGFGRVPAMIQEYAEAVRHLVDSGKPVFAVCSGAQIANTINLAFPRNSKYNVKLLQNICDSNGKLVYHGFLDRELYTRLSCNPQRTAFTRSYEPNQVMQNIIDHGGGRFWADDETLKYLIDHDLVVKQFCDDEGNVLDEFPTNPNGSLMNIESITNLRGNVKIGMAHDERKTNALKKDEANYAFASMREYIEDKCPDLGSHVEPFNLTINKKDYSYLSSKFDNSRTFDVYVRMLTDDNERNTAQLFLDKHGKKIERRRLIRLELRTPEVEYARRALKEISSMDFYDGIMLKKDLSTLYGPLTSSDPVKETFEVVSRNPIVRDFRKKDEIVPGFSVFSEQIPEVNPGAYVLYKLLMKNDFLRENVTGVKTGSVFFFPDEESKDIAKRVLFGGEI